LYIEWVQTKKTKKYCVILSYFSCNWLVLKSITVIIVKPTTPTNPTIPTSPFMGIFVGVTIL
jgi:hypothetical protein